MKYLALFVGMTLAAPAVLAAPATVMPMSCKKTPIVATTKYPGEDNILPFNNLAKPRGKSEAAEGQLVFFSGRVVDVQCVPVSGAIVELWQANPFGKEVYPKQPAMFGPGPVFAGAGRTYTNNQGKFTFVTLFPGGVGKNGAPRFNIRITHPNLKPASTALFFEEDRRNEDDPAFKRIKPLEQAEALIKIDGEQNAMLMVSKDLVLESNDARKGF
ncbi:MAG: hypothetical protein U1E36_00685 [Rickettsiales bacterium]